MILLYVDDGGDLEVPDQHCVIAGIAIDEADVSRLAENVEEVRQRVLAPTHWDVELHAQHIRAGKGRWRTVPRDVRSELLQSLVGEIAAFPSQARGKFACFAVVRSPDAVPHAEPVERTYEELLLRFDAFLRRRQGRPSGDRGLVIADESKFERVLQPLVTRWRSSGTRRGKLRNLVEVPLFADSRASVLLQVADLVAYSVYRSYQGSDATMLNLLRSAFDTGSDGRMHGLTHLTPRHVRCACMACISRHPRRSSSVVTASSQS